MNVADFMTADVHVITPEMLVSEAISLLTTKKISGAPMVDKSGTVLSVVSEGDLLRLAAAGQLAKKMGLCMAKLPKTENLIVLQPSDDFAHAYKLFLSKSIHRIVVTDANGKLQGIVSRSNVLRLLVTSEQSKEVIAERSADEALEELKKTS